MSRLVILRPAAQAEYDDGVDYLATVRPELGEELARRIYAALARLVANPRLGAEAAPGVRKFYVSRTRYCIYYSFGGAVKTVRAGGRCPAPELVAHAISGG